MTEDEIVKWHHRLSGHEFEQTPGSGEDQGSLSCFSPQDHKELDTNQQLNNNNNNYNNKNFRKGKAKQKNVKK